MKSSQAVDIVMRSYNEAWALKDTLSSLSEQTHKDWRLHVIDSGSTDGSIELFKNFPCEQLIEIKPEEYIAGKVLNMGMEVTKSEKVVFLNADATPANNKWLENLLNGSKLPNLAASFGRQLPRPNCQGSVRRDFDLCFGPNRESKNWNHFFSMVNSLVDREYWSIRPFRSDMRYAEDHDYTLYWKLNGKVIQYVEDAEVIHSHNYTTSQAYKRAKGDAFAIAQSGLDASYGNLNIPKIVSGSVKDWVKDLIYCTRSRCLMDGVTSLPVRLAQRSGRWAGTRTFASSKQ